MGTLFSFLRTHQGVFLGGVLTLYFIVGVFIVSDYGVSWDEDRERITGLTTYTYVVNGDRELFRYFDRDYGTAFQLPLIMAEKVLGITDMYQIFHMRHLFTFLLFFISVIFFYKICRDLFTNKWIAILGVLFLILSPRIFADSFYNSKDIATLAFFVISIYSLLLFLRKPSVLTALFHAAASAYLTDIRLVGLLLPVFTIGFFIFDWLWASESRVDWQKALRALVAYVLLYIFFVILFWPYLWENPLGHFLEALANMSHFDRFTQTTLYLGEYIKASEVPWHYLPVWVAVTTPLVYILFFAIGLFATMRQLMSGTVRDTYLRYRREIVILAWLLVPLIAVFVFGTNLYDGWRHFYFIYPAFLLIALCGITAIVDFIASNFKGIQLRLLQVALVGVVALNLGYVSYFMVQNHPYQNLYFNALVGDMTRARDLFEMDYWGLSFKEGLKYIAETDQGTAIPVLLLHGSAPSASYSIPDEVARRMTIFDNVDELPAKPKYVLSNYRWHKEDYPGTLDEIYSVKIEGTKVMSIFKIE